MKLGEFSFFITVYKFPYFDTYLLTASMLSKAGHYSVAIILAPTLS